MKREKERESEKSGGEGYHGVSWHQGKSFRKC